MESIIGQNFVKISQSRGEKMEFKVSQECHQRKRVPKNRVGFGPTEGCVKVCQWLSYCLHRGSLCDGRYTPIEIVTEEHKRVYSMTRRINPKSRKALRVRSEQRQVTLRKWKEQLSGSSKGEWTRLLIHDLEAWLEGAKDRWTFHTGYVWPWGVQRLPIPHEVDGQHRLLQVR